MAERHHIRHRVERTRNKHSRAVYRDGTIIIRLARGLSKIEEKEHITDLLRRMTLNVLEERDLTTIDPFRPLLNGGEQVTVTLATGKKYTFVLRPGKRTKVQRRWNGWAITIGPRVRRATLHRLLWKTLAEAEAERVDALVQRLNEQTFGIAVKNVRLCFASTQWGSCSPRGTIMLNTALLFMPLFTLKYVIIHELAHRKRADHSPQYWEWVAWAMPSFKRSREALHDYRLPIL